MKEDLKSIIPSIGLCILAMFIMNATAGTVCFSVLLTGVPCPACGITRASVLMMQGRFVESFQMHPLLPFFVLLVLGSFIIKYLLKKSLKIVKLYAIMIILAFVVIYVYRMVVYFPHIEPMLYERDNLLMRMYEQVNTFR